MSGTEKNVEMILYKPTACKPQHMWEKKAKISSSQPRSEEMEDSAQICEE